MKHKPAASDVFCTVCAAADRGVLCTGVLLLLLLSHSTICPEYVPPTTTLGWNLAKAADITADCQKQGETQTMFSFSTDEKVHVYSETGQKMYHHVTSNQRGKNASRNNKSCMFTFKTKDRSQLKNTKSVWSVWLKGRVWVC